MKKYICMRGFHCDVGQSIGSFKKGMERTVEQLGGQTNVDNLLGIGYISEDGVEPTSEIEKAPEQVSVAKIFDGSELKEAPQTPGDIDNIQAPAVGTESGTMELKEAATMEVVAPIQVAASTDYEQVPVQTGEEADEEDEEADEEDEDDVTEEESEEEVVDPKEAAPAEGRKVVMRSQKKK